ncbi:hypothetical protein, partial [Kribbella sancticallisti]|uniref:hypothetical protein n=1 Tax=Kribbella sancticallisti TaxID=460087 RepID=UPI0031D8167C
MTAVSLEPSRESLVRAVIDLSHDRPGEVFEAVDGLGMLRGAAIVPLMVRDRTSGVRRIEQLAPEHVPQLNQTVAATDRAGCLRALRAAVDLLRTVRPVDLVRRTGGRAGRDRLRRRDRYPAWVSSRSSAAGCSTGSLSRKPCCCHQRASGAGAHQ